MKTAVIGALAMGALVCIFAEPIIGLFTETDAELLRLGSWCIRTQGIALVAQAWVMIVNMLCGAIGYGFGAVFLSLLRQGICFIPIIFPLAWIFGDIGLCSAQAAADGISIFVTIPILRIVLRKIDNAEGEHLEKMAKKKNNLLEKLKHHKNAEQ